MTRGSDGNGGAVFNSDMTVNRVWIKRVKDTDILGEVGDSAAIKDPLCGWGGGEGVHVCADASGVA
jgi:hypothetical protein